MRRFANDLEDYGRVEKLPVLEGKRMIIMLTPKKGGAPKASASGESAKSAVEKEKSLKQGNDFGVEDNKE